MTEDVGVYPIRNFILIRHLPEETTESGMLHLPQGMKLKNRALVLAVGSGHLTSSGNIVPLEVKPGDFITVAPDGPMAIVEKDRVKGDLIIVQESSVVAIDCRNETLGKPETADGHH